MRRIYTLLIMTIVTTFVYGFTVDGIEYSLSNNQATVTGLADKTYSGELVIPDNVIYNGNTYPVTSIYSSAFEDCTGITSVHIGNNVSEINQQSFINCTALTSINIPESVVFIGIWAFKGCSKLASFTIPNSVTKVGYDAFTNTAWYDNQPDGLLYKDHILLGYKGSKPEGHIDIENGTRVIAFSSLGSCSGITSVSIPNTIKEIGYMTFWECESLSSIIIPSSITTIEAGAFGYCSNLASISFDNTSPILFKADSYCDGPFPWCKKLSSIYVKDLSVWCGNTFEDHRSTPFYMSDEQTHFFVGDKEVIDLVVPDGVSSINQATFYKCKNIRSVTIPNSVKAIGLRAFWSCNSLKEVYSLISEPFTLDRVFSTTDDATLYVPIGTKAKYEATAGWNNFKEIVEMSILDPIDGETTVNTEGLGGQDLTDNVVDDVYYNLDGNNSGYDSTDGSIVIGETTNMGQITNPIPGTSDVANNFTGLILRIAAGKGTITVNVKTIGNAQLVVQVGDGTPMIATKTEQGDVVINYDVAEDTYIYIYAIIGSSGAPSLRAASDNVVKIYGIKVTPGSTGINTVCSSEPIVNGYYTLDGRKIEGMPTKKGLYIVNGRKVVVK